MSSVIYRLESRMPLPANGQTHRLNFDKPISDDDGRVSPGPSWSFRVAADGVYFIQASVLLSVGADLVVSAKARPQIAAVPLTLAASPYISARISAAQVHTMAFLKRGDEVWFEAGHSFGDNPPVSAVEGIASIALLHAQG